MGEFWDIFIIATDERETPIELSSYLKIWKEIIKYVCNLWRHRCTMVSLKNKNSLKFQALREVDSILDSFDATYIKAGDKSLLRRSPDSTWKLHRIKSWLKSVQTCIRIGKKFASKTWPTRRSCNTFLISEHFLALRTLGLWQAN